MPTTPVPSWARPAHPVTGGPMHHTSGHPRPVDRPFTLHRAAQWAIARAEHELGLLTTSDPAYRARVYQALARAASAGVS